MFFNMKLFQVGDRDDSNLYISAKMKAAAQVWVECFTDNLDFFCQFEINYRHVTTETIFQRVRGTYDRLWM